MNLPTLFEVGKPAARFAEKAKQLAEKTKTHKAEAFASDFFFYPTLMCPTVHYICAPKVRGVAQSG